MAAILNVVEPFSTGGGGDAFALIYEPDNKIPRAINGSGWAPSNLTYSYLSEELGLDQIPLTGVLPITIPGAVSAWWKIHEKYGKLSWKELFKPAIHYAQNGYPVSPLIAQVWEELVPKLLMHEGAKKNYLIGEERAPNVGEIFKQPALAKTFITISNDGVDAFYKGEIAERIINFMKEQNGFFSSSDLSQFEAEWTNPISLECYDHILWEHGPNGQGIVTQLILGIVEELDIGRYSHNSVDYFHILVEAKKMAFSDAYAHLSDPKTMKKSISDLLSEEYFQTRASQINPLRAAKDIPFPLELGQDTVYLTAADNDGYAISFINSLFYGFGSGVVDPETGISFQNRGAGFTLEKGHPNQYSPRKRPFHTIIPGMITSTNGDLLYSFGVMGGHHQPQGQAQVFLNAILFDFDPQAALSSPRFHHEQSNNTLAIEDPIEIGIRAKLRKRGHSIVDCVGTNFGGGQMIKYDPDNYSFCAGSDPRKDGSAQGY